MTKLVVASALALALLTAPALAGPNPTPAPTTIQVGLKVDGGKDQRHYTVKLLDKACGSVTAKTLLKLHATTILIFAAEVGADGGTIDDQELLIAEHAVLRVDHAARRIGAHHAATDAVRGHR